MQREATLQDKEDIWQEMQEEFKSYPESWTPEDIQNAYHKVFDTDFTIIDSPLDPRE